MKITYRSALQYMKKRAATAAQFQNYLSSPIPSRQANQTSQQYRQRLNSLKPQSTGASSRDNFQQMVMPSYGEQPGQYQNALMSQQNGQQAAATQAVGQGVKDYYKNTTFQQQARNAGAAATGAVIGTAKGFLSTPFLLANAAGKISDFQNNMNPLLKGRLPSLYQGTKTVTQGVNGFLDSANNWVSDKLGAEKGVAGTASGVAETGSGITFPSFFDTVIATKPGKYLYNSVAEKLADVGKVGPVSQKVVRAFKPVARQGFSLGVNQSANAFVN